VLRRATKTEAPAESAGIGRAGPAHILVINDDENACELLVRLLARAGHDVQRAHNADQALAQLSVGRVECVVLDLASGGIGRNLKLVDTIRSSVTKSISDVRVVLVAQQSSSRLFSWQAGIDAFVARPFHANEFLAQVSAALSRADSERERHRRQELDAASAEVTPAN
jgi:two-component system, OmpR family, alkaline phosphatase synthesis response regulator PhoP